MYIDVHRQRRCIGYHIIPTSSLQPEKQIRTLKYQLDPTKPNLTSKIQPI